MYKLSNVISELEKYVLPETVDNLVNLLMCNIDGITGTPEITNCDESGTSINLSIDAGNNTEDIRLQVINIVGDFLISQEVVNIAIKIFPEYLTYIKTDKLYRKIFKVLPFGNSIIIEV